MYVSAKRLPARMSPVPQCLLWLSLSVALVLFAHPGLTQDQPGSAYPELLSSGSQSGAVSGTMPGSPSQMQSPPSQLGYSSSPSGQPYNLASNNSQSQAGAFASEFHDAVEDGLLFGDAISGRSGEAFGTLVRAGVWTGPAVGRDQTIVPIEAMPYAFTNNTVVFGSFRGFRGTNEGYGMNVGGGIRIYSPRFDRIIGANVFYDYDNSSGALFRQVGFGGELLGEFWDARANAYIPDAQTSTLLSTNFIQGSQKFVGHQMTYSNLLTYGNSQRGADMEFGVPVPGRIPKRHNLKVFAGAYYYSGSTQSGFAGWKVRAQADVIQNLNISLEVTSDRVFDTNVVFGATYTYGGFRQPEDQKRTQFDRMTEMVRRNYNVIVAKVPVTINGIVAINPLNNAPYFFEHVESYYNGANGPSNGTVNQPWLTEQMAANDLKALLPTQQQQEGNIIYVHANSVFNGATLDSTGADNVITPVAGVRILGEGTYQIGSYNQFGQISNGTLVNAVHLINVPTVGQIPIGLARSTQVPNAIYQRPIYEDQIVTAANPTGSAINLTNFSGPSVLAPTEFSGFQIGDPTSLTSGPVGYGIYAQGAANLVFGQDDVNFAQKGGIALDGSTGLIAMPGTVINNVNASIIGNGIATGPALDIENSTGTSFISFTTDPTTQRLSEIINFGGTASNPNAPVGPALVIQNQFFGSTVDMTGSSIYDGSAIGANVNVPVFLLPGGGVYLNKIDGTVSLGIMNLADTTGTNVSGIQPVTLSGPITTTSSAIEIVGAPQPVNVLPIPAPTGIGTIFGTGAISIKNPLGDGIYYHDTTLATFGTVAHVMNVNFGESTIAVVPSATVNISNADAGRVGQGGLGQGGAVGGAIVSVNNAGNISFNATADPGVSISATGTSLGAAPPAGNPLPVAAVVSQKNSGSFTFGDNLTISGSATAATTPLYNGIQVGGLVGGVSQANTGNGTFIENGSTTITGVNGYSMQIGDKTFSLAGAPITPIPFQLQNNPTVIANDAPVTFNGVTIDSRGSEGIVIAGVDQPVTFNGVTAVKNTSFTQATAVDIENNLVIGTAANVPGTAPTIAGDVSFANLQIVNALSPVTPTFLDSGSGLNIVQNESTVKIPTLSIGTAPVGTTTAALWAVRDGLVNRVALAGGGFAPSITSVTPAPRAGLLISTGTITTRGTGVTTAAAGGAVEIQDSVIGITLSSVTTTLSDNFGIDLRNNIGPNSSVTSTTTTHQNIFTVNAGSITTSQQEGVFLLNSEGVTLDNMTISNNGQSGGFSGVYAQTPSLVMLKDTVQNNGGFGVNVNAVAVPQIVQNGVYFPTTTPFFDLDTSVVSNNKGNVEVAFTAEALGAYTVELFRDGVLHTTLVPTPLSATEQGPGNNGLPVGLGQESVYIQSAPAAAGSTLTLLANNSTAPLYTGFTVTQGVNLAGPAAAFEIDWNGNIGTRSTPGSIDTNNFSFAAASEQGLYINLSGGTNNILVNNNAFLSQVVQIPVGVVLVGQTGTTGIDVAETGGTNNISITNNKLTWTGASNNGGGLQDYGIHFQSVSPGSFVNIYNNGINYSTVAGIGDGATFTGIFLDGVSSLNNNQAAAEIRGNILNEYGGAAGTAAGLIGIDINSAIGTMRLSGAGLFNGVNIVNLNGITGTAVAPFFQSTGLITGQIDVNTIFVP